MNNLEVKIIVTDDNSEFGDSKKSYHWTEIKSITTFKGTMIFEFWAAGKEAELIDVTKVIHMSVRPGAPRTMVRGSGSLQPMET